VRGNISIALQYLDAWLQGTGAVAIFDLMEDTATAEISRAQLWQWIRHRAQLDTGAVMDIDYYRRALGEERTKLERAAPSGSRLDEAATLLDRLVRDDSFVDFLTIPGYDYL
jgi:malate synthase